MKRLLLSALCAVSFISQIQSFDMVNLSYEYAKNIPAKVTQPSVILQTGKAVLETIKNHPKMTAVICIGFSLGYVINIAYKKAKEDYFKAMNDCFNHLDEAMHQLSKPFRIENGLIVYLSDEEIKKL